MSFAEADKYLNDMITAVIDCKKAALKAEHKAIEAQQMAEEATLHAGESNLHAKDCRYWADKFKKKGRLIE